MRGTRWLLLMAIVAIVGGIGFTYRAQKRNIRAHAPERPKELDSALHSESKLWTWTQTDAKNNNRVTAKITAEEAAEVKDSSRIDLKGMTLTMPSKKGDTYNVVKSALASLYKADHRLFAEGQVEIALNVPLSGPARRTPVTIHSSRVTLDTNTYRTETDEPSWFTFQNGDGSAKGAYYDPTAHELRMKSDVDIHYTPAHPGAQPMTIQAGGLVYHEANSEIRLEPWGKFVRDTTVVEGENPVIHLRNHEIQDLFAMKAHGSRDDPGRKLQYAADELWMGFNDKGQVEKTSGKHNARLVADSTTSQTTVTADNVDLFFQVSGNESILTRVEATGQGVVTAKPLAVAGRELGETHVLKSDRLEMQMRPGGREIEKVATHAASSLEFLPNLPTQHHRVLTGNDMLIAYGAENRLESFHSTNVRTVTDPTAEERKRNRTAQSVTTSHEIQARFDPMTSHLASMEQWGDFKYVEGDRQAHAARATLDANRNTILLDNSARMWDATGATSADRIQMDQRTGDFTAEGNVNSSRMPDKEKDAKKGPQMLSTDQPLQAQARRMVSTNRNRTIRYEGGVVMWQGSNRITAETVDVDREKRRLVADRNVVSDLWEEPKDKKPAAAPVRTVVHAAHLVYTDEDRLALYTGGVHLERPKMDITGKQLRAYLAEAGADSRLEKAFADGNVRIFAVAPDRNRTFTGEHSEYYTDEQKVIMTGGHPKFVDTLGNSLEGEKLTYYSNDGRLLSDGPANQPPQSHVFRKRK